MVKSNKAIYLFLSGNVLCEGINGIIPGRFFSPAVELQLWSMETPQEGRPHVSGIPRRMEIQCWDGVLYDVTTEPREPLGAGDMFWVVVFIIGEVEGVLLAEEGGGGGLGGIRSIHLVHQEFRGLADILGERGVM